MSHYDPSNILLERDWSELVSWPKTAEHPTILYKFKTTRVAKKFWTNYKHKSFHFTKIYVRIFVLGHYLFLKAQGFPQATLSENCSLSEQIISADKHPNIFPRQMETLFIYAIPFKYGKRTRNIYGKILFFISLLYLYFAGEIKKRE